MKTLINTLINHIKGISGLTNPMITKTVQDKYKVLSRKEQRSVHAILNTYLTSLDEDEVNYALFLKNSLT